MGPESTPRGTRADADRTARTIAGGTATPAEAAVVGTPVVGAAVVGAAVVGAAVVGAAVVEAAVVEAAVVEAAVVGAAIVGAAVVGPAVVGPAIVGAAVVGAAVIEAAVFGAAVVEATVAGADVATGADGDRFAMISLAFWRLFGALCARAPSLTASAADTSNVQLTRRPARRGGILMTCFDTANRPRNARTGGFC